MAAQLIGTHNGTFHCDEALACFFLKCLPKFSSAKILRTRDEAELAKCDVVVDVGSVYDPARLRFDHHQREFALSLHSLEPQLPFETKLSSAGLVYAHFGRQVICELARAKLDAPLVELLFRRCYADFVEEVDAIDNGLHQFSGSPRYTVSTNLSSRVSHLNPAWNDPAPDEEAQFARAVQLTGAEFSDRLAYLLHSWWPARDVVLRAFRTRHSVDPSGALMLLETACPWKEHIFDVEAEQGAPGTLKYCFFYDERQQYYMIVALPVEPKSFANRAPLAAKWRGLRGAQLCAEAAIDNCVFVHASGFCGANRTKEGAVQMMRASLAESTSDHHSDA